MIAVDVADGSIFTVSIASVVVPKEFVADVAIVNVPARSGVPEITPVVESRVRGVGRPTAPCDAVCVDGIAYTNGTLTVPVTARGVAKAGTTACGSTILVSSTTSTPSVSVRRKPSDDTCRPNASLSPAEAVNPPAPLMSRVDVICSVPSGSTLYQPRFEAVEVHTIDGIEIPAGLEEYQDGRTVPGARIAEDPPTCDTAVRAVDARGERDTVH